MPVAKWRERAKDGRQRSGGAGGRSGRVALALTLAALVALYVAALAFLSPSTSGRELTLDALIRLSTRPQPSAGPAGAPVAIVSPRVATTRFLDEDSRVTGILVHNGGSVESFWAAYPASDAATNDLLRALVDGGTEVSVDAQSAKGVVRFVAQFLLPLVILANLFALMFSLARGGRAGASPFLLFGRMGDKRVRRDRAATTTFANVAAAEEAKAELSEVRDYLADPAAFERLGALPPKGVLLMGPPGCGKTLLARAVAGEANACFFSISGSEFVESLVGVGAARVRDLFRQARAAAPSLIFIDELDAAGRQRGTGVGGGNDEREQTLNELLVQMDGFSPRDGVVVLAATNRADILDPALLRAGRFDRHITVERPDLDARLRILELHAKGKALADPARDLPHIARRTSGFTGADLANLVNEAALLGVRERAEAIGRPLLDEAVERVISGPKRRGQLLTAEEKRRIAYHEAGHAVVAAALGHGDAVEKVSVVARGGGVGHLATASEDKVILTRPDMETAIAIAMAGIAAEELVFGHPSTGSEQDLGRATETARDMAGRFGMSTRLGRMRVLHEQREAFLGRDYLSTRDVSQPTMEHLDAEIRRILDEEEAKGRAILGNHRDVLDAMAAALASRETLQGDDLGALLAGVRLYGAAPARSTTGRARRANSASA